MDDAALIRLVYYFCCGIGIKAVADALGISRKSVRDHYLDLRARLRKPKFRRWHAVYGALATISDQAEESYLRGAFIEALATCHYSDCHANYDKGNRKSRICRRCPLSHAFSSPELTAEAIGAIDDIRAFYTRLGIRGEPAGDKLSEFFERLVHSSVVSCVGENSNRLANGLPNPADTEFQGIGTLIAMLMDDLADDHAPRIDEPS